MFIFFEAEMNECLSHSPLFYYYYYNIDANLILPREQVCERLLIKKGTSTLISAVLSAHIII